MDQVRAGNYRGVSAVSLHTYYDPAAEDPFVPGMDYLRSLIDEFHAHGIPVCSIPFEGGETEEAYLALYDLGIDAFSSDYPSTMFAAIRHLRAAAQTQA